MASARSEFTKQTKREGWQRCHDSEGVPRCERCGQPFQGRRPEYDHIKMCELGGDNSLENCEVLCPKCHREKTSMEDMPMIWKSNRIVEKRAGLRRSHFRWPRRHKSGAG